ncbi:MAG: VOC family protein [Acidobacteriaceae bacterium]|nr:VOC family protein [Acidobacteriaceae bacterium]MBV9227190.1 VOC family protein [Acidobacteriaceae bacterium]
MQLNPYLQFNGQCEAAFQLYQRCLGGKIEAMMKYADAPPEAQVSPDSRDKIMHARLVVGDAVLMGSDGGPERYELPKGFCVSIQIKDPAEAERIFNTLAENGQVHMPLQQTFWAARFGMLRDQFGIPWMVNCEGDASERARA